MKNLLILLISLAFYSYTNGQPFSPGRAEIKSNDLRKIQAMEMAFITKELNLNPDEAQKFWPIFNQYRNEIKAIASNRTEIDRLEKQQKMLDLRKKYREDFTKVIAQDRANRVFGAEDDFKSLVRREFQKRESEKRQFEGRKKGF
jgi:hypothetical protein